MKRSVPAIVAVFASVAATATTSSDATFDLSSLPRLAEVDERYQSYNVEMVEVTGGAFWAPYGGPANVVNQERAPLDLTDARLIAFARLLAPAYMRVSGTWANNTYLPAEGEAVTSPPSGYTQLLTRQQWRDVVGFSKAAGAPIVTSFAVSAGTRGPDGVWKPAQAQRVVDLTRAAGGTIAAAEFFNEPNIPTAAVGMPKGYDARRYGAEFRTFRTWARQAMPDTKILGPGGAGEATLMKDIDKVTDPMAKSIFGSLVHTRDIMRENPNSVDVVSYHHYGAFSQRCTALGLRTATKAEATTPEWLDRTAIDAVFYGKLRDEYEPGKPLWLTETAQAACGGSPWASTFLDSFRYLNQLGVLAQRGVQVVAHNTLATSDYALIDRDSMTPRPNFWAAVLWRRIMGRVVLTPPASPSSALRLYAHCLRDRPGGVALLALNLGDKPLTLPIGKRSESWTMAARPLDATTVTVNGRNLGVDATGRVTGLAGMSQRGPVSIAGRSIVFVEVPDAANAACR